jgi:RNA polymerase sigma factor (sigma-70 family)
MSEPVNFGSTVWAVVDRAKRGDERAVDQLIRTYRKPVVQFIRRQGVGEHDAEDLAQEVFLRVARHGVLKKVLQTGGKFRSLLIGVTKNVLHENRRRVAAKKRGGDVETKPLPTDSQIGASEPQEADDETFDQFWMLHLVNRAFENLQKECVIKKTQYFDATKLFIVEGLDYAAISAQIDVPLTNLKNLIRRGKQKLLDYIRQEIADYSQPGSQYEQEVKYLMRYLQNS